MHYIPAFAGFLTSHDIGGINAALKKARSWQICEKIYTTEELIARADKKLFQKAQMFGHCIHQLLPPLRDDKYLLRKRGHPFRLCYLSLSPNCLKVVFLIDVSSVSCALETLIWLCFVC